MDGRNYKYNNYICKKIPRISLRMMRGMWTYVWIGLS
jgi:hypothetical protein